MTSKIQQKNLLTYDVLVNTVWVSTTLALILTLPSLGIFLSVFLQTSNWFVGALLAFAIHFIILAFSDKISNFLLKFAFFEDKYMFSEPLFSSDYSTFETDEENIKILANQNKGKKQIEIHIYLLEHQLFHQIVNRHSNYTSINKYTRVF